MITSQSIQSRKQLTKRNSTRPNIFAKLNLFSIFHLKSCMHMRGRIPQRDELLGAAVGSINDHLRIPFIVWMSYLLFMTLCHKEYCSRGNLQSHLARRHDSCSSHCRHPKHLFFFSRFSDSFPFHQMHTLTFSKTFPQKNHASIFLSFWLSYQGFQIKKGNMWGGQKEQIV